MQRRSCSRWSGVESLESVKRREPVSRASGVESGVGSRLIEAGTPLGLSMHCPRLVAPISGEPGAARRLAERSLEAGRARRPKNASPRSGATTSISAIRGVRISTAGACREWPMSTSADSRRARRQLIERRCVFPDGRVGSHREMARRFLPARRRDAQGGWPRLDAFALQPESARQCSAGHVVGGRESSVWSQSRVGSRTGESSFVDNETRSVYLSVLCELGG